MASKMMMRMILSRIVPILAAIILISPTLFSGGNLVLLQKAEAATINITTDTTWGDKTILPGTVYNIAAGATLTISGKVSNHGDINVYGTLDIASRQGELVVTKQGKEQGTLNIYSGGTVNDHWTLRVNGLLDVNPGGTLNIHSDPNISDLHIYGTLNIDGSLVNDGGFYIYSGAVIRINEPGILQNSDRINLNPGGTLNINNGAELDNEDGFIYLYSSSILKVFTGGTLDNSGGLIYKYCSGTLTLNPGAIFKGNPITGSKCIAINNVSLNEGNSGTTTFAFKVTRSGITTGTTTLDWITASGTATAGTDYVSRSGTLTFTDGQTSKTVNIGVKGDTTVEPNERFTVRVSDCSHPCEIVDTSGRGSIINDDG